MTIQVKHRIFSDRITLKSKEPNELYKARDEYECLGYQEVLRRNGFALYQTWFTKEWRIDMRHPKSQLEMRMEL